MARFLSNSPMRKHPLMLLNLPTANSFMAFMGVLCVFSLVAFLCGTHKRRTKRETDAIQLGERKKLGSGISSKALLMAKMISWRKVHEEEDEEIGIGIGGEEEAVWKRTIIMGEKCRPVDFSGRILYDSEGNPLPETTPPSKGGDGGKVVVGVPKA